MSSSETKQFVVTGMTCAACSAYVERSVRKLPAVASVSVNLLQNTMLVNFDKATLSTADIIKAVEDAGYGAKDASALTKPNQSISKPIDDEIALLRFRLKASILFLIPLAYVCFGSMLALPLPSFFKANANLTVLLLTQFLLCLPILWLNRKFFIVGFKALAAKHPNMDSLVGLGAAAAVLYSLAILYVVAWALGHGDAALAQKYGMDIYFDSAAMILTLITAGKFLEARSKGKTSEAVQKLLDLTPKTATVLRNGMELEIAVNELVKGDIVIIRPGASLPADGVVTEGHSVVDESALTGESIAVEKAPGDKVSAATVNSSGYFRFKALQVGEDTTLAQIIRLVDEANATKAPIAKLADRVSAVFVPVVIAIATLTTLLWLLTGHPLSFSLSCGIAVLVISCPCALGLATPAAIMTGTGRAAELGILFKSSESLELAHKVNTIILDKTGTVTEGCPQITGIYPAQDIQRERLIQIAASLEKLSEHPLALPIVNLAERENIALSPVENFCIVPGRGILGEIDGQSYSAGNRYMLEEAGLTVDIDNPLSSLYFFSKDKLSGTISLEDSLKSGSREAIIKFKKMGLEPILLTGDNAKTAMKIANEAGIERVIAEVLPQDKATVVKRIQDEGKKVAMVGDGINDAPALACADVGIAIGAGTDIAIEAADVVLVKSNLLDAVTAIELSGAVIRNIKQNLFWAFFYNVMGIPLAAGALYLLFGLRLSPVFAAAAMSLSSFCVLTNSLRLKFFKPRGKNMTESKTIMIEGMTCGHCTGRVEKALNALPGVTATVSLEKKCAQVTGDVSEEVLIKVIEDTGYKVLGLM